MVEMVGVLTPNSLQETDKRERGSSREWFEEVSWKKQRKAGGDRSGTVGLEAVGELEGLKQEVGSWKAKFQEAQEARELAKAEWEAAEAGKAKAEAERAQALGDLLIAQEVSEKALEFGNRAGRDLQEKINEMVALQEDREQVADRLVAVERECEEVRAAEVRLQKVVNDLQLRVMASEKANERYRASSVKEREALEKALSEALGEEGEQKAGGQAKAERRARQEREVKGAAGVSSPAKPLGEMREEKEVRAAEAKARVLEEAKRRLKAISGIAEKVGKGRMSVEEVHTMAQVVAQVKALADQEGVEMPWFKETVGMAAELGTYVPVASKEKGKGKLFANFLCGRPEEVKCCFTCGVQVGGGRLPTP